MAVSIRHALFLAVLASAIPSLAEESSTEFFEKKIRPVLVEHCYKCHAADAKKVRGGLLLDSREGIRRGGESGAGVVPHKPDESLVLDAIRYESFEMPPSGKLPDHVVRDFEKWIEGGAVDPRAATTRDTSNSEIDIKAGRQFWSFQPLQAARPPRVKHRRWPESEIDRFLLARLEGEGLTPVGDADRVTIVRRLYYALVGLPPTPPQIADFVNDT